MFTEHVGMVFVGSVCVCGGVFLLCHVQRKDQTVPNQPRLLRHSVSTACSHHRLKTCGLGLVQSMYRTCAHFQP